MIWRAWYTMERWHDAVLLEDRDAGDSSVTNDADRVVDDLVERGIDVDRVVIVYRDPQGIWDQILTRKGEFVDFHPLGCRTGREAAVKARRD